VQAHLRARSSCLPGSFDAGQSTADDNDFVHNVAQVVNLRGHRFSQL
jgi:hypothetical protein